MVYFLGRDVIVCLGVENTTNAMDNQGTSGASVVASGSSSAANNDLLIRTSLNTGTGVGKVDDLTGVDITLGSVDEDIAYMGQRTALKAEIKKETTVVLTKKKTDQFFSSAFSQGMRYGVADTATVAAAVELGLQQPAAGFGFRICVGLKDDSEVITVAGCTFSEYATTVNADGVTEETLTFISHVTPVVAAAESVSDALGSSTFPL